MIEPIKSISAVKIISETGTQGNSPLLVYCDDMNRYYAKTTTSTIPRVELINEIICYYFLKLWGLPVPEIALIKIDKVVVDEYVKESGPLSNKYSDFSFNDVFVGFKEISPATELEQYIRTLDTKHEWNKFDAPIDLIKIGIFDIWICNKDRKPENPNILIGSGDERFQFVPIDHAASFGYATNYNSLSNALMYMEENFFILKIPLVRSIAKFVPDTALQTLNSEILAGISLCLENLDDIFSQVPENWGFSKKAKAKLREILSDKERNKVTSERFFPYIKP